MSPSRTKLTRALSKHEEQLFIPHNRFATALCDLENQVSNVAMIVAG
jgi:hypothetical protein